MSPELNQNELNEDIVVEAINGYISKLQNKGKVSDGYHTMTELYDHRCALMRALCIVLCENGKSHLIWKSKKHSDGSSFDGWFLLGIGTEHGYQITYHMPEKYWDKCKFADVREQAPEFDGHNSQDVYNRLMNFYVD